MASATLASLGISEHTGCSTSRARKVPAKRLPGHFKHQCAFPVRSNDRRYWIVQRAAREMHLIARQRAPPTEPLPFDNKRPISNGRSSRAGLTSTPTCRRARWFAQADGALRQGQQHSVCPHKEAAITSDTRKKPTLHLLGDGTGSAITVEAIAVLYERLTGKKMSAEEIAYGREKLKTASRVRKDDV
jgi:hypothetical protein